MERCSPMHENMDKMRVRRKDANQPPPCVPTSPSLTPPDSRIKNLKYVIFPDNRWIQVWDLFMIFAIWNYAFSIPFSFGISRGYYSATSQGYWIYRVIINIGFFGNKTYSIKYYSIFPQTNTLCIVDTFLPFFRAYRDKHGRLVLNLTQIRKRYIRSG